MVAPRAALQQVAGAAQRDAAVLRLGSLAGWLHKEPVLPGIRLRLRLNAQAPGSAAAPSLHLLSSARRAYLAGDQRLNQLV